MSGYLDPEQTELLNFAIVGAGDDRIKILNVLAVRSMTHEQALVLAAYLVAMNDHAEHFDRILERVESA